MNTIYMLEQGTVIGTVNNHPCPETLSIALFCPECGTIWGRIIFFNTKDSYVKHKRCIAHGDGSFFSPTDALETLEMSDGLACYEAAVSLKYPEKYQQYTRWTLDGYRV